MNGDGGANGGEGGGLERVEHVGGIPLVGLALCKVDVRASIAVEAVVWNGDRIAGWQREARRLALGERVGRHVGGQVGRAVLIVAVVADVRGKVARSGWGGWRCRRRRRRRWRW